MDSKYIHLIALVVAVFFAGVYMRGEGARKKEIKRELEAIQKRQDEINSIVDQIEAVTAEKDSLLLLQVASAKAEVQRLERLGKDSRARIASLGNEINARQALIINLGREINAVPDFAFVEPRDHSVYKDRDRTPGDSIDNTPTEIYVAPALAAIRGKTSSPAFLAHARRLAKTGVKEVAPNRGPQVDSFLTARKINLKQKDRDGNTPNVPWCAAFVSYCLDLAGDIDSPSKRSLLARDFILRSRLKANFFVKEAIDARIVQRGGTLIEPGTLVIWKSKPEPQDLSGHIGFVIDWEGQAGTTVEGNTGPGKEGNQADGDGVYFRKRMLSPGNAFRITHFLPVTLKEAGTEQESN